MLNPTFEDEPGAAKGSGEGDEGSAGASVAAQPGMWFVTGVTGPAVVGQGAAKGSPEGDAGSAGAIHGSDHGKHGRSANGPAVAEAESRDALGPSNSPVSRGKVLYFEGRKIMRELLGQLKLHYSDAESGMRRPLTSAGSRDLRIKILPQDQIELN